jgi:hypothetical protein
VKRALLLALAEFSVISSPAQTASPPSSPRISAEHTRAGQKLTVTMTDENGVAVGSARVQLEAPPPAAPPRYGADFGGHCEFTNLPSGTCLLEPTCCASRRPASTL